MRISWINRRVVIIHGNSDVQGALHSMGSERILKTESDGKTDKIVELFFGEQILAIPFTIFRVGGKIENMIIPKFVNFLFQIPSILK